MVRNATSAASAQSATTCQTATTVVGGAITTAKLANGAVTAPKIATGAVTSTSILDGTIAAIDLASGAVTTAKLADAAVTVSKVADGVMTDAKLSTPEQRHIVGAAGEPAFASGISSPGYSDYLTTRFKKVHGVVYVVVNINRSVGNGSPIFTLPAGYRPSGGAAGLKLMFAANSNGLGVIGVKSTGEVLTVYQTANPLIGTISFPEALAGE